MKKCYYTTILFAFIAYCLLQTVNLYSQVPQSMNYQAVARNANGSIIPNQRIGLRFTIHDGTSGGAIIYRETNTDTTNQFGLFTAYVGGGSVVNGTFGGINWGSGSKYLQVEIDVAIPAIGTRSNPLLTKTASDLALNKKGYIIADEETGMTSKRGVFAGGDIITGSATVILAMGAGRKAAKAINEYIKWKHWDTSTFAGH